MNIPSSMPRLKGFRYPQHERLRLHRRAETLGSGVVCDWPARGPIPLQPRPSGSDDSQTIARTQSRLKQTKCFAGRVDSVFIKAAVLNDWVPSKQRLKFGPYLSKDRCVFNGFGVDPM